VVLNYVQGEENVSNVKKDIGLGKSDGLVLSVSFVVNKEANSFALGELSGRLKDILSMLQNETFKFRLKSKLNNHEKLSVTETHNTTEKKAEKHETCRVFTISAVFDNQQFGKVEDLFECYKPKKINLEVNVDQAPSSEHVSRITDFINFDCKFNFEIAQESLRVLEALFILGGVAKEPASSFSILLRSLNNVNTRFEFDADGIKHMLHRHFACGPDYQVINWNSLTLAAKEALASTIDDDDVEGENIPEPLEQAYRSVKQNLSGIYGVRLFVGNNLLEVKTANMNVFHLLPTLEDVLKFKVEQMKNLKT